MIFDFDGTLVDTSVGIINCVHYAFNRLSLKPVNDQSIRNVIGKPLPEMLKILFATSDPTLIDAGVSYFRERYSSQGLLEVTLYNGVIETLNDLVNKNICLFIVTSKPYEYTKAITNNLGIYGLFDSISGVLLNSESPGKSDRVRQIISDFNLQVSNTVMVGDRADDVIAATNNGITSIGLLSGYGNREELIDAGCNYIIANILGLRTLISDSRII